MEFILVRFDPKDARDVLANGNVIGKTGATLMVTANFYRITLSGGGYTPLSWTGTVSGTLPDKPLKIEFAPAKGTVSNGN